LQGREYQPDVKVREQDQPDQPDQEYVNLAGQHFGGQVAEDNGTVTS